MAGEQESEAAREVTVGEALAIAIGCQQNDRLADAAAIYKTLLELVPDDPAVLHYAGLLAYQQGNRDNGIAMIQRSLEIEPNHADCYSNLGIMFRNAGRTEDAIEAYRHAIALNPQHANAYNNLGVLLKTAGRLDEAEAAYRHALAIDDAHIDAYHNLGNLLAGQRRTEEAVACYAKVTELSPRHREARRMMALAQCELGKPKKAIEIYRQWLDEDPADPLARHMLAACSGQNVPARASDAYIDSIFGPLADSFDQKLAALGYRAPQIVAALVNESGCQPAKALDILDAGCGTGLCGPLMAPYARTLAGVDLSAAMLAKAAARGVYDELVNGELTAYLQQWRERFDVVISADTLVYFGDLRDVVRAAASALRRGGWLIFTVEEAVDAGVDEEYRLAHHGRYQHAAGYVERVLADTGLRSETVRAELRMESGVAVVGLAVRAHKSGGDHDA